MCVGIIIRVWRTFTYRTMGKGRKGGRKGDGGGRGGAKGMEKKGVREKDKYFHCHPDIN